MTGEAVIEFIEDWQMGFFLLVAVGIVGIAVGAIVGSVTGDEGLYLGALGGMVLGFLVLSYLRYGR